MRRLKSGGVMGLDLSLRGAGLVVLEAGWVPGYWKHVRYERFTEQGKREGDERVEGIVLGICAQMSGVSHVFVEEHSFAMALGAYALARAELVGAVRWEMRRQFGLPVRPIVASSARKILFGKLPRMVSKETKALIGYELGKMGAPFPDEDTRDAFVVANAGWSRLGRTAIMHPSCED